MKFITIDHLKTIWSHVTDFLHEYSSSQWMILSVFCILNIFTSFSVSIHAPFFPLVAHNRGFSPSEYGIVFGIFNLMTFLISPICGKLISNTGARFVCSSGVFVLGVSSILFGFINNIIYRYTFLSFSIILRIFQGIGYAAFQVSSISIISNIFPNDIETSFACLTSFSSLGFIIGPTVGGILYEIGGFKLPFITIGITIILGCGIVLFILVKYNSEQYSSLLVENISVWSLLKTPAGCLGVLSIFGVYLNTGFIISTLEAYLESSNLSPVLIGTMFIYNGVAYSISSFVWSKLCSVMQPEYIWSIGAAFIIIGLSSLSFKLYFSHTLGIYVCAFGLLIHGVGEGAEIIAGLSRLNYAAQIAGCPQNIQTYGKISTIYTSALGIGIFIGSVLGGSLYKPIGFVWTAHVFSMFHLILAIVTLIYQHNRCGKYELSK